MKYRIILPALLLALATSCSTNRNSAEAIAEKQAYEYQDSLKAVEAVKAIHDRNFVLEADRLQFKTNTTYVNYNTNFVSLRGDKATVQVAPFYGGGPNGVGGITVDGTATKIEVTTDKRGDTFLRMNVMGTGVSAEVTVHLYKNSNKATCDISPNFNSRRVSLSGKIVPADDSSVFKGTAL